MVEQGPYKAKVGSSTLSRCTNLIRSVAQSGSAPALGAGGPRFESLYSDQFPYIMKSSPDRNSFQRGNYIQRKLEEGKTPENNEDVRAMVEYYDSWEKEKKKLEQNPEWQEDNLEYDLRSTEWICMTALSSKDIISQTLQSNIASAQVDKTAET